MFDERDSLPRCPIGLFRQKGEDRQKQIESWQAQEGEARLGNCPQLESAEVKVVLR